jgi:hypothetical protein
MRLTLLTLAVAASATGCFAQNWEFGGGLGYGWALNTAITGVPNAEVGHAARGAFTVILGENPYNYIGGELQYLFRPGGTELRSNGILETASGYNNVIVYDILFHLKPRESKFRPFVGAGAGIKVYTNSDLLVPQPLAGVAFLSRGTQVEPAISLAGGAKYLLPHHVQLRLDMRVYTSPTPNDLIRPIYPSRTKGWIFDLTPMVSLAYVF